MKKRIVLIAEYFPPRLGADRRPFEIMKRLSNRYDVHFITLPPSYVLFIGKIESLHRRKSPILCEDMMGHEIELPRVIWNLWNRSFVIPFALTMTYVFFQTVKKLIELKPDIIVVNNTSVYTGLLGFICSRIIGRKLLVNYDDLVAHYTVDLVRKKVNWFLLGIMKYVLILVEHTIVRSGWKVVTHTNFIRNYAVGRNLVEDLFVIPDGVDINMFNPIKFSGERVRAELGIGDDIWLCVYAGRIDKCQGADILIRTIKLLGGKKNVKFIIVGEGNTQIIRKFSECDNVILTGKVPHENVPKYLAAADIVLIPFPETLASHSVSPLKLFEGLAMKKPVIASALSGIKEVVEDGVNGILVTCDPKEWAMAIMELVENPGKASFLAENARKKVCEKYDWDKLAQAFSRVIENEA